MANQYPFALNGAMLVGQDGVSPGTTASTTASTGTSFGNLLSNPAFYFVFLVVFIILYFAWASSAKTKYYPGRRYY